MGSAYRDGHRYDFIVVGSGMGGAVVARELAKAGRDVLVLESGKREPHVGTFTEANRFFDTNTLTRMPKKSKEGTIIWRAFLAGGSTVASCGNGVRCLQAELAEHGVDLADDLAAMEAEMGVRPQAEDKLSDMGRRVLEASRSLGYSFELMPKIVDPEMCTACGNCIFGCAQGAKWTAERPLAEAVAHGAEVVEQVHIERALRNDGHATGVAGRGPDGAFEAYSDTVVLAAGGLGTPPILAASGIDGAGEHLFIDELVNVYGATDEPIKSVEPTMSLVDLEFHDERGFLLSPYISYSKPLRLADAGSVAAARSVRHMLGMMVKTRDDGAGRVFPDGTVSKPVTEADRRRLDDGAAVAAEVLVAAGANRDSVIVSHVQGAHPGGTAAIGELVDTDLQTAVEGLFVADGSVLPEAPGLPPMVTIGALARRLGRTLATA